MAAPDLDSLPSKSALNKTLSRLCSVARSCGAPLLYGLLTASVRFAFRQALPLLKAKPCSTMKVPERCMSEDWAAKETNTHQTRVIAHVIGATVLGYFVFDETFHALLTLD